MRDRLRLRRHDLQSHRRALPGLQQNFIGIFRRRAISLMLHFSTRSVCACVLRTSVPFSRSILSVVSRAFSLAAFRKSMNQTSQRYNTQENSVTDGLFFTTCNIVRPHDAMHFANQHVKDSVSFGEEKENYIRSAYYTCGVSGL